MSPEPHRPQQLPGSADRCLEALARQGLGATLSIGGAVGLLCYHDYRATHDLDAWWEPAVTAGQRREVIEVLSATLGSEGRVRTRSWGEVISIELLRGEGNKKAFSFQIAARSARLEPPEPAPWVAVLLDRFSDLVASKMTALVERGAPRDLRDIDAICHAGLITPSECWRWWRERCLAAGDDADPRRARLAIESHLALLHKHRPLAEIRDSDQQAAARRVRTWFKTEFLDALMD